MEIDGGMESTMLLLLQEFLILLAETLWVHGSSLYILWILDLEMFIDFCSFLFFKVGRIPFNEQIQNFEATLDQITRNLGAPDVAQALSRCIFFVGMGSNDYLNNYLMPNYNTKNQYNPQQFADLLIQQYTQQLTVSIFTQHFLFIYSGGSYFQQVLIWTFSFGFRGCIISEQGNL